MFAVQHFNDNELKNVDHSDIMAVRRINDKLMFLERFFIDHKGLPGHPETKLDYKNLSRESIVLKCFYHFLFSHIVFSTSTSDSNTFNSFAGLVDLIVKVENSTEVDDPDTWMKIRHHLSVIAFLIGEAGRSLSGDF